MSPDVGPNLVNIMLNAVANGLTALSASGATATGSASGLCRLSSHKSPPIQAWLEAHLRVQQDLIPKGAC